MNGIDIAGKLRTAAGFMDSAASLAKTANELPLRRLLFRGGQIDEIYATYARAVTQGQRAVRELEGVAGPAQDAMAGVDELLAKIDPRTPRAAHQPLEHVRDYSETRDVATHLGLRADRLREVARVLDQDPATVRAALDAEVGTIVGKSNAAVTADDMRRLAVIDELPAPFRPELPARLRHNYPPSELVARGPMLPGSDNIARGEFMMHRLDRARRAIVADPTTTREALDAEVRAIIATPDAAVTNDQLLRLSAIAGLGDDLRPAITEVDAPWTTNRLADLAAWNWLPGRDGVARAKFNAMRMFVEHEAMLADPRVTRESVTNELVDLLAVPNAELTDEQVYRTSLLARLPEHLRPPMPERIDHYAFQDMGLLRYHPARSIAVAKVFDQARVHMAAVVDPELTVRTLADNVRAGRAIDFRVIAALDGQDALLARHGLTKDVLNREAVTALSGAGYGTKDALRVHIEKVRDMVAAIPASDPKLGTIRAQALELAERNLDRMAGKRTDTFSRHPDYAEVGRIVAIAELLDAVRGRALPAAASAATDAATGAERLTW